MTHSTTMEDCTTPRPRGATRRRAAATNASAVLTVLTVLTLPLGLAACGSAEGPLPVVTVTVYPSEEPTSAASAEAPSPEATPTPTPTPASAVPTSLEAGSLRGAPRSYADALTKVTRARPGRGVDGTFVSPTGNIFCAIRASGTTACEVREGRIGPPVPDLCPPGGPTDIGRIELTSRGAVPVCDADTIRESDAPRLRYGFRADVPGSSVLCLSEERGVTCVDTVGHHGFFLARGSFSTF